MLCDPFNSGQKIMRVLLGIVSLLIFINPTFAIYNLKPDDVLITDFESILNCFGGSVNSVGASEGSGYTTECAYSGVQCYKLVFNKESLWKFEDTTDYGITGSGSKRTKSPGGLPKFKRITWAVFVMNLGPVINSSKVPSVTQPFDMSPFRYLIFWVKGKRGDEHFKIYFRDVHATTYDPQLKIDPKVRVSQEWRPVVVELRKIKKKIDLHNITQIGIGYGIEDGGSPGDVLYIDNFILVK